MELSRSGGERKSPSRLTPAALLPIAAIPLRRAREVIADSG